MKSTILSGAIALALFCAIGTAWSADGAPPSDDRNVGDGPAWLAGIADQQLIAVDGSTITLSPAQDRLGLALVSPAGAEQKKLFVLLSDNLGTIADAADSSHIVGFFRVTDSGLEQQFSDGHTESLTLNGDGGLSLAVRASGDLHCTSWYPSGHVFSEAERRAALADYANRLGLAKTISLKAPGAASCPAEAPKPASATTVGHSAHRTMNTAASDMKMAPILVRESVVHAIDGPTTTPMSAAPTSGAAPWSVHAPLTNTNSAAIQPSPPAGHGASDCLSVESDGANLGFRNQCGYAVQFAYCLQTATEQAASCDIGSNAGSVPANAFTPLLFDSNIKAADAEHDFRWVACGGEPGEIVAHLDRSDPPAGRCVRTKTS
jgi:hypothetical protein